MRILEFEHKHFGVEDMKEILPAMGHELTVISTPLILERRSEEFDKLFDSLIIGNMIAANVANMMLYLHLTTALSYPTAVTATTSLI